MQDTKPVEWLRLRAVADELGMSRETARQLVLAGELEAERHGKRGIYRVRAEVFRHYQASKAART